jgi:ricin-type beta-trefoil lectin protein/lysozyme-like protein
MKRIRFGPGALAVISTVAAITLACPASMAMAGAHATAITRPMVTAPARPTLAPPIPVGTPKPLGGVGTVAEARVCAAYAAKAGFSFTNYYGGYPQIVVAVAVGLAESNCTDPGPNSDGATGMWQIIPADHPPVTTACLEEDQCNADDAKIVSNNGTDWSAWAGDGYQANLGVASQGIFGEIITLHSQGAGTCLDADSSDVGNGGKIFQWGCNSSDSYQRWLVEGTDGSQPILESVGILDNDGKAYCLDADSTNIGNGGKIFQWQCNRSDRYQQWWFYGSNNISSDSAKAGIHNQGTRTCLDVDSSDVGNGGKIFQWGCNQSDGYQEWN